MLNVIYNPIAGRGRAAAALPRIRSFLDMSGVRYQVASTGFPGHAIDLVGALPSDARVVVVGGDGTAHEAASACVGNGRSLSVIPVGSGDDFAFALGIDRSDLHGALTRLLEGRERLVDTGTANGKVFINAAGVGFDADVARRVRTAPGGKRGSVAYLYGVLTALGSLSSAPVEVTVDDEIVYRGRSLLVSTQLGPRTGGSFLFAPEAKLSDGMFDVVVAGDLGRIGTVRLLPKVMRGRHLGHPRVLVVRGRTVTLRWERPQAGHVDGEALDTTTAFDLRLAPASLRVVV